MKQDEMQRLEDRHLAGANAHDAATIGAAWHEAGYYQSMPLGVRLEGRQAVLAYYAASFTTFPDFAVTIEGTAFGEEVLAEWGYFEATMTGPFLGVAPTGRRVRVPIAAIISFRDGQIEGEKSFFDLADLCAQAGVDIQAVLASAKQLRPT
jgi:steroid delta-isomerase-like uncharacterized protein